MSKANTKLSIVVADSSAVVAELKALGAAVKSAADSSAVVDEKIKTLKTLGVKTLGDTRTDANAQTLKDYFVGVGVKAATAKNYISDVRYAFENNTPFVFNAARKAANDAKKGDAKKKGEAKSDADKMIATLLNVWKLSDAAEEVLIAIEQIMSDGTPLIDAIAEVLREAGEDLGE